MLYTAYQLNQPSAVRYPRGSGPGVEAQQAMQALPLGKGRRVRDGKRVAILAFGSLLKPALEAAEVIGASVADMRFVKPVDEALVRELAATHELLVTVEEHAVMGGAGSAISESLAAQGLLTPLLQLGLPDRFVDHGDQYKLLAAVGLDRDGILASIKARLAS
jgi:1-deoxy-D-xylulose-5-phosphate synthase